MSKNMDIEPEIEARMEPAVRLLMKHYECVYVIGVTSDERGVLVDLGGEGDITLNLARQVLQHAYNKIMEASIRQAGEQFRFGDLLQGNYSKNATTRF